MTRIALLALALVACAPPAAPTCRTFSNGALFFCSEDLGRENDDAFIEVCESGGNVASTVPCAPGTGTCVTVVSDGSLRRFVAYTDGSEGRNLCEYLGGAWTPREGL